MHTIMEKKNTDGNSSGKRQQRNGMCEMELMVLQVEERAAEGVRHNTRHGRHAMWGAGMWREGQERTGCEAK
jgi:hypothetical protein